ncbi:MAG: signal peptidase I [Candidatus Harrisonbacteria bacterium]|nr:signal peptidase I [Candidatus Harrisonbacteria bacterium]
MRGLKKLILSAWEVIEVLVIALAAVFLIRNFIAQPFLVSGASMEPNFSNGNYLIVDEVTYRFRGPERGEVVVFRYPKEPSTFFIKRIIGLPGDRILIRDNQATVISGDGQKFAIPGETNGLVDIALKTDEYFVLGDNRYNSLDSRNWGPLPKNDLIGIVRFRIFPINQFGVLEHVQY